MTKGVIGRPPRPAEERFWEKVDKPSGEHGCWIWTAWIDSGGYGRFGLRHGFMVSAHRFGYELMMGPIPDGLQIDHLCRNRSCVNYMHMEAVTPNTNWLRGEAPSARNARKTHCIRGHPFNDENTHIRPRGQRMCRACNRIKCRDRRRRKRDELAKGNT